MASFAPKQESVVEKEVAGEAKGPGAVGGAGASGPPDEAPKIEDGEHHRFQLDDVVYTIAVKHAEDWDNYKAVVVKVPNPGSSSGKYKVRMEEGPQRNKTREFTFRMLSSTTKGSSPYPSELAAAAGTGVADPEKAERKRKAQEAAAALFSKLPKL